MDYKKIYLNIIKKSKIKQYDEYTEKHHIVPKCVGGTNKLENLVTLSYREHFLCHWLLCKIYPNNQKIKAAFAKMLETTKDKKRIISSHMFDIVKRNLKNIKYEWLKNSWENPWNKGLTNKQVAWNKGIMCGPATEERKRKTSETLIKLYETKEHHRKGKSPWCANTKGQGLVKAWNKGVPASKSECIYCKKLVDPLNMKKWHGENCKHKGIK